MNGELLTERLLAYARRFLHLDARDEVYMRNVLLAEFGLHVPYEGAPDVSDAEKMDVPDALNAEIAAYALENGLADESSAERFCTDIFGMLTQLPSQINASFNQLREKEGPQAACDYLYDISVKNGYIQKTAIAKNLKWNYTDGSRRLEITVNLSKPEKKNKDIAKLLSAPQTKKYPACLLCKENEGFGGTASHPARRNIRTIKMTLGGEKWFMQYSPYAYYDEHCIVINEEHVPMNVDARTPDKLLDFVDLLPNYSIGSNASLPIVGGSILNHEHYQGGLHLMPMHSAGTIKNFRSEKYPSLRIGILDWYNSAIRIEGEDRTQVSALAAEIDRLYETYYDRFYNKQSEPPREYAGKQADRKARAMEQYGFRDVTSTLFYRTRILSAKEYVMLLGTYSDHIAIEERVRKEFFAEMEKAIRKHGGQITIRDTLDLQLGRKA